MIDLINRGSVDGMIELLVELSQSLPCIQPALFVFAMIYASGKADKKKCNEKMKQICRTTTQYFAFLHYLDAFLIRSRTSPRPENKNKDEKKSTRKRKRNRSKSKGKDAKRVKVEEKPKKDKKRGKYPNT